MIPVYKYFPLFKYFKRFLIQLFTSCFKMPGNERVCLQLSGSTCPGNEIHIAKVFMEYLEWEHINLGLSMYCSKTVILNIAGITVGCAEK